jgi:alcohol dehydrogenase
MKNFEYENKSKLYFGSGSINEIGDICIKTGGKPMLVTTHSIEDKMGFGKILDRVIDILSKNKIQPIIFDRATLNPTTDSVDEAVETAIKEKVDYLIGLGGGSAVDTSKAIAVAAKTGKPIWNYLNGHEQKAEEILDALPVIAVDTTAGTGTAVTKFFVVTNSETKEKSGNGCVATYPAASIVDPELMLSIPEKVTSATGLDVLFHALESFVATKSNKISDMYAIEAIKLVKKYLPIAYNDGSNLEARENMALASMLAGYSIDSSTVVLAHSIAHAISGITGTAHGLAIASISDSWLSYTYPDAEDKINEVINIFGTDLAKSKGRKAQDACRIINDFKSSIGVTLTLKDTGITESLFKKIVDDTFATMQYCVDFQPGKKIREEEILKILVDSYK